MITFPSYQFSQRIILIIFQMKIVATEAVAQRCSVKKVFLEILQNSQENTCARVSFLIKLQATLLKKRLWHRSFPVNFAKFRRTPIFTEQLRWLLLLLSYSNLLEETSIIIKNVYFIQLYRYFNFAGSFNLSLKLHDHLFDFFYG